MEVSYTIREIIVKTIKEEREEGRRPKNLQLGAWKIPYTGYIARLHRGEMVLPRPVAEWFRRSSPYPPQINISVNVGVLGSSDPRELAEAIALELKRRMRMVM